MKKFFALIISVVLLLCLTACGGAAEEAGPYVALTDVAAEAVPADEIAPADLNEVAVATEEMILSQPMEPPMEPASGEPSAEPNEESDSTEDDTAEE